MTHYRNEDTPDMSNPQVALDMWQSQLSALKPLAGLEERADNARQILSELAQYAHDVEMPQLAADAQAIWKTVAALVKALKARDAALEGAKLLATAERGSRLAVLGELKALKEALSSQDTSNPDILRLTARVYEETEEETTLRIVGILQDEIDAALPGQITGASELITLLENLSLYPEAHEPVLKLLEMAREEFDGDYDE